MKSCQRLCLIALLLAACLPLSWQTALAAPSPASVRQTWQPPWNQPENSFDLLDDVVDVLVSTGTGRLMSASARAKVLAIYYEWRYTPLGSPWRRGHQWFQTMRRSPAARGLRIAPFVVLPPAVLNSYCDHYAGRAAGCGYLPD